MPNYDYVSTVVASRRSLTSRIYLLELTDIELWKLPPFAPGAHIDVHLPSGLVRQYSLCSDPAVSDRYQIAVLREENGRGGSKEVADDLKKGDEVSISLPRNLFPLNMSAERTIMIAGGIGITPIMSMIPVLLRGGCEFEVHFCTRSVADTPFLEELSLLAKQGKVIFHHDDGDPSRGLDFKQLISSQPLDTHYYCCGPSSFIDDYVAATAGLPEQFIHYERFVAATPDAFQPAYALTLRRSGLRVDVGKGESVASALQRNGIKVMVGCGAGICGLCRLPYLAGHVVHRDFKLSAEERKSQMTSCVSGCLSDELVLDI